MSFTGYLQYLINCSNIRNDKRQCPLYYIMFVILILYAQILYSIDFDKNFKFFSDIL